MSKRLTERDIQSNRRPRNRDRLGVGRKRRKPNVCQPTLTDTHRKKFPYVFICTSRAKIVRTVVLPFSHHLNIFIPLIDAVNETWTLLCKTETHHNLHIFQMQYLRRLFGVTWKDRVCNEDVLYMARSRSMVALTRCRAA